MTDTTDIAALREQWETLHSRLDLDIFITTLFTALEAERQRADELQSTVGRLAQESNRLFDDRQRINKNWTEAETDNALLRDEIAALKAKLANPVVLEYRKHDGFTDPEKVRLINAVTDRCAAAIKESGFTVKGE